MELVKSANLVLRLCWSRAPWQHWPIGAQPPKCTLRDGLR
jgi:hypothetical protein